YLNEWYATPRGDEFAGILKSVIRPQVQGVFGYHALQIGALPPRLSLLEDSLVNHKVVADKCGLVDVLCQPEALPFTAGSIDLIVLTHVLECSGDPHAVLRECERVLVPEGHLLIVGLDPWTLWGGWQLLKRHRFPLYDQRRVRDWLELLGFELNHSQLLTTIKSGWLDGFSHLPKVRQLANLLLANISGGYILFAQKRVTRLTPLAPAWRQRPRLIAGGIAEPAAREIKIVKPD
ncbi:MAG TPA: class I SAM-dependent methyltransferase, partial [Gammaproteobacteria bacterium]|nr:class I SAM-dependent methyltransferase [Gammaproteobacteria bacterium]